MLLRPILSRIHKRQRFANFCILNNGGATLENAIFPSSSKEKSVEKGYVVSYLVNSCGLSQEKAISAAKRVHFDGPHKPNAALDFLEKQGFSKTQIADVYAILRSPFYPKIEFFLHFTGISEFLAIVARHPDILSRSLEHKIVPVYNYVKDIIGAGKVDTLLRKGSWIFHADIENRLKPNVDFLRELGVPKQCLKLALSHCTKFFSLKQVELRETVEEVKQMGFDPSKSNLYWQ